MNLHNQEKIIKNKLGLLTLAQELGNAPNINNRAKEEDLKILFENVIDIKERNSTIVKAYKEGYSQHVMDKVL